MSRTNAGDRAVESPGGRRLQKRLELARDSPRLHWGANARCEDESVLLPAGAGNQARFQLADAMRPQSRHRDGR
jgi:hypothetical protein